MKYTTPLRYPGGKSRAIKFLSQHLPKIESYREPFLGGGSMALYVTQTYPNTDVWVNDLYYPLYAFWVTLRDHGQQLCDDLRELKTELGESYDAHRMALLYGRNAFVFLDPPYAIKDNLYGNKGDMHKSFDHEWFAAQACASDNKCMITYNSELFIKDRFPDWYQKDWDLTYTMRSSGTYTKDQKKRKELLLLNYEQQTSLIGLFKDNQRDKAELTG